eukprot:4001303-Amphidinium_carterae.1
MLFPCLSLVSIVTNTSLRLVAPPCVLRSWCKVSDPQSFPELASADLMVSGTKLKCTLGAPRWAATQQM